MSYWNQKVVLITGGSAGLGKIIAQAFATAGANVVLVARDQTKLDVAVKELQSQGHTASSIAADITNEDEVQRFIEQVIEKHGQLDVLVNNAGISSRGNAMDTTAAEFQKLIDLNLYGTVNCTRLAAPHLIQSKGHLINIGSLAAKTASPHLGPYVASKFALAGYNHQLRLELAPQGVHVLLVCPGPIRRDDADVRYDDQTANLPQSARKPGGGAKIKGLDPNYLANKILQACIKRKPELILPFKARILFAISAISPTLGDWILRKFSS